MAVTLQMLKNENKRDNLFILTNVFNVSICNEKWGVSFKKFDLTYK